jgi:PAS domain S-box-containing protein
MTLECDFPSKARTSVSDELSRGDLRAAQLVAQLSDREIELHRSERRMDAAATAAEIGMWEWNIAQDEIWATERCRTLFGLGSTSRLDLNMFLGALHPDDRDRSYRALQTALKDGGNFYGEYRVALADGRIRWIVTRGRADLDANGKAVLVSGVSLDNTAQKRAAAALQESEERFRVVANTAPVMIWMTDADNSSVFFNEGWLAFTGRTAEQESGSGWADGIHPEDLQRCLELCLASFRARRSFTMEFRLRRHDGQYRWLLDTGVPRFEHDGTFVGFTGSCIDVTERKESDELLARERAFLRQVIDVDPNLIFAKDHAGRFTLVNQALADLYGTTVENLIGKTDADFNANPSEIEHFRRIDEQVMDTLQERFIPEERITDARGKVRWLQTIKRPIRDEHGRASQLLGSATDITRRKDAELELARQRNELAHLSRVAMLGEMSGSLAHELNQPLTAILSNAQAAQRFLAMEIVDVDELREILKDIVKDDKRAGEIIHGLRQLLTKGEVECRPVDLNELVRDVIMLVRSDLVNGGISLSTGLAPRLPLVNGDPVQLQQVLINLVMNGCDAMSDAPAAERQLVIRTSPDEERGGARVSVIDNGRGIPPDHMERVFEPFYTTKAHGLGLGLAVCRTIISAHEGVLWADSNSTRGARFQFTVPGVANVGHESPAA